MQTENTKESNQGFISRCLSSFCSNRDETYFDLNTSNQDETYFDLNTLIQQNSIIFPDSYHFFVGKHKSVKIKRQLSSLFPSVMFQVSSWFPSAMFQVISILYLLFLS